MTDDLNKLWGKRVRAFWKEAGIYWSYAARSGLTAFLILFFIIGSYGYMKILEATPTTYPYWRVTTPIVALALALSPVRTFLMSADTVFLMPAESKLNRYWLNCQIYSFVFQAAALLAALLLVWPLYRHCEPDGNLPVVALPLVTAKLLAVCSRFHEGRLLFTVHQRLAAAIRWTGAVVIAFALFVQGAAAGWGAIALFTVILTATIRLLPKHRVPWEQRINWESRHLKLHYTFFSWFADVPKLQAKPKPRMALAAWVDKLPFTQGETYRYLYGKTLVRSEWLGILGRIAMIAVLVFVTVENSVVELLVYGAAVIMGTATLSSLAQSHRYSFWLELFPAPRQQRARAVAATCFLALLPFQAVTASALLLFQGNRLPSLIIIAAGFLYTWYYTKGPLTRKAAAYEEE